MGQEVDRKWPSLQLLEGLGRCPCKETASWVLLYTCPGFELSPHLFLFPLSALTQGQEGSWDPQRPGSVFEFLPLCVHSLISTARETKTQAK